MPEWRRIPLVFAAAAVTLLLGLIGCGSAPTAMPTSTPTTGPITQQVTSSPTTTPAPDSSVVSESDRGHSPTPESQRTGQDQPHIDILGGQIAVHAGKQTDPFLQGLSLWDDQGQRIRAGEIVSTTIVWSNEDARLARWTVALQDGTRGSLSVLAEQVGEGILSVTVTPTQTGDVAALGVCLPAELDEHFYGLGERFDHFDLTGHVVENRTAEESGLRTTYAPATFLLSSQGYGLHLDMMGHATYDLRTGETGCYLVRAAAAELHLYFFAGPTPQDVVERHARFIGFPPLPPDWAFGVWKNLIGGRERLLSELQDLRDADVPLDAVWIYDAVVERDGFGWPWQIYEPIPPGDYPDLVGLIEELHAQDLQVLGYLNPFVYPNWPGYDEAAQEGYLVQTPGGEPYLQEWTFGQRAYVDFTGDKATTWWQARVRHALGEVGFDGAMLDFGEDAPHDGVYAGTASGHQMDNEYPVLYHRAAFEAGQEIKPGNFVFLARAGYSGSQPYTTGRFTGDQVRSWDDGLGLSSLIPAVLNGSLSGWPYWGPDIAGFFQGERAVDGSGEKELWIRWVQLGALMPTMRDMYGAMDGDPVDLWTDKETLAVFRTYAQLHTALAPYLYRYAEIAHEEGLPIVRPLFLNYPDEVETYTLEDQYLLGDDLLVAPILEPDQDDRSIYLPEGRWRYYWTDQVYEGGNRVTVSAPLYQIPFLVREGVDLGLPSPGFEDL